MEMKEKKMRNNNDGCLPFFIIGLIVGFIGVERKNERGKH